LVFNLIFILLLRQLYALGLGLSATFIKSMTINKTTRIKSLSLIYSTLHVVCWAVGLLPLISSGESLLRQTAEISPDQTTVYVISPASTLNFSLNKPEEILEVTESEHEPVNTQKKQHVWWWISSQHSMLRAQPYLSKVSNIATATFARFASFPFSKVLRI